MDHIEDAKGRVGAFPLDWWKSQGVANILAKCFAEHLVTLEVAFTVEGEPAHDACTGFLMRLGPIDLWMTAGHVIDQIRDILASPKVNVVRAGLLDGCDREDAVEGAAVFLFH